MSKFFKNNLIFGFIFIIIILVSGCSASKESEIIKAKMVDDIEIINMGKELNSDANDYSLEMSSDGQSIYFTSDRTTETKKDVDDDIWFSKKNGKSWSQALNIGKPINIERDYEFGGDGSPSLTSNGKKMFFASSRSDGIGNVDIYSADYSNGSWSNIQDLGTTINSKRFDSHPSISADGKTLYFSSDREGGYGGMDIWVSKLDNNGNWEEPLNLGSDINTSGNESSPFIAADNVTLYFCSNGHPGYGKYDIFVSRKLNGSWSKPENLGKPINSENNDRFPSVPATGNYVYFSSDRSGGFGKYDMYVGVPNPKPPKKVNTIAGVVTSAGDKKPMRAYIEIVNLESKESIKIESDKNNGKYFSILSSGSKFSISAKAEGYNDFSDKFEIEVKDTSQEITKNITLSKVKANLNITVSHVVALSEMADRDPSLSGFMGLVLQEVKVNESLPLLNYIFFDKESSFLPGRYKLFKSSQDTVGFKESALFGSSLIQYYNVLNIIGARLKAIPKANITLIGCNDNLDKENNNTTLSRARAVTIQDYLVNIWGIDRERIKITARNLPELPSPQNTPDGQSENRRVEIQCDNWEVIKPISFGQNDVIPSPEKVLFNINVESDKQVKEWVLTITQDGAEYRKISGNKPGITSRNWDWKSADNALTHDEKPLTYSAFVVNSDKDTAHSYEVEIPVKKVRLVSREEGKLAEKQYEKISLILFDFNKYELNTQNQRVLDIIYEKITSDASVQIFGYTDDIGTDEVNLDLSNRRAKAVFDTLKKVKTAKNYYYEGLGKTKPLYNNLSPEGRFYNRTVQIIVEKDVR